MNVLLDHLTAVIVGVVLLGAFVALQIEGSEEGVEAALTYRAEALVGDMARTVERDLENARSRSETERAFANYPARPTAGADTYRFRLRQATTPEGATYTSLASFPTLLDPERAMRSELGIVTYRAEVTDERATVDGDERALLRVTRYVYPRGGPLVRTGVYERVTDFDITAYGADGTTTTAADEVPGRPTRLALALAYAPEIEDRPGAPTIAVTHGRTIRPASMTTVGGATALDREAAGGIPELPGDPGYSAGTTPITDPVADPDDAGGAGAGDVPVRDEDGEYILCHEPTEDPKTKTVKPVELAEHLGHGDTFGACPGDD